MDPATGALRVATGSNDIRVWDAETGGALLVIVVGSGVNAPAFFVDRRRARARLLGERKVLSSTRSRAASSCSTLARRWALAPSRIRRRARRGSFLALTTQVGVSARSRW